MLFRSVIDNLATNFMSEVDLLEAQYFYGHQTFIEQVHANGYSLLIESYVKDEKEKLDLFNSMETSPSVAAKASWAEKWKSLRQHINASTRHRFTDLEMQPFSADQASPFLNAPRSAWIASNQLAFALPDQFPEIGRAHV